MRQTVLYKCKQINISEKGERMGKKSAIHWEERNGFISRENGRKNAIWARAHSHEFQWKISLHNFHGTFSGICIVLYWKASCSTAAPRTNWLWLHWHSVIHINTVNVCMILAQQIVRKYIGHFVCETSNGTLDLVYLLGCGGEIHEPRISYHDKSDKYFVRIFSVTPQCWCHSLGLAFFSRHSATVRFFAVSSCIHAVGWLVGWRL